LPLLVFSEASPTKIFLCLNKELSIFVKKYADGHQSQITDA
jgi:hypothetical protein